MELPFIRIVPETMQKCFKTVYKSQAEGVSAVKHASTKGQGLILVNSGTMSIFSNTETISNRDNIILELITEWYWQLAEPLMFT